MLESRRSYRSAITARLLGDLPLLEHTSPLPPRPPPTCPIPAASSRLRGLHQEHYTHPTIDPILPSWTTGERSRYRARLEATTCAKSPVSLHTCGSLTPVTSWTLVENELANHLSAGKLLELKGRPATQRLISADCIRNLVRGRRPGEQPGTWVPFDADPRGLQLLGATVADRVDLDYITASTGITFIECNFPEGISAGRANLASLSLENCTLGRVDLEQPALTLLGATVNWHLVLSETTLTTAVGPALAADSVQVGGSTLLPGLHATGEGAIGTVRLAAARIGGQLILSGATITNANGPALAADNIRVDGLVRMANGFTANGEGENGAVRL